MHYLLLTSSVMALMYITVYVVAEGDIQVFQKPRFFGVKTGRTVMIYCVASNPSLSAGVVWLKGGSTIKTSEPLKTNPKKIIIMEKTSIRNASITIKKVDINDSGIYFCRLNDTEGPGTELQEKKEDAIYDEPEVDHTYEGLEIDHCGDIYEDISTLAPVPDAVWEVESPDQE
ncbi:hypothetical protein E1301_Tti010292 [Triplophysa tibetana]|uniref:Ig-like domain-containing protein n=1 Tax=Triplophysa tibetana TaxID=1572043 RepID=A0A5A9PZ45_9TELE|nr:hypothetical protein E1301_Tti010292 [Triplophysa tibetana]